MRWSHGRHWRGAAAILASCRGSFVAGTAWIRLTGQWVAEATSAAIVSGQASAEVSGVSIDSRTLAAGELFVAIRGERFDGANFVAAALSAGAAGVVVPRGRGGEIPDSRGAVVLEVDEPVGALQAMALRVRRESG